MFLAIATSKDVGLSNSSSASVASGVGLYLVMFLFAMGILIWKVAPNGYMAVDTTWYICGRYQRQIRRSRMTVGSVVFVGFTGVGVWLSWELNSLWPLGIFVFGSVVISAGYEPEVPRPFEEISSGLAAARVCC